MKNLAKKLLRPLVHPLWQRIQLKLLNNLASSVNREVSNQLRSIETEIQQKMQTFENSLNEKWQQKSLEHMLVPRADIHLNYPQSSTFMAYSTCAASDFFNHRYAEICKMLDRPPIFHRKMWEWVYIVHHLMQAGALGEGKRGLGFGVGQEPLPAFFASLGSYIVATDASEELSEATGWSKTGEHCVSLEHLKNENIIPNHLLEQRIIHQVCDMNEIDPALKGFDFTWSACCFEHLGSLKAGIEFVINSVEKTLKMGGIACHTTEYNLSSNDETLTEGSTVIYRYKDIQNLILQLRERGHEVEEFRVAPDTHYLDYHIDLPPYLDCFHFDLSPFRQRPHLKLKIENYVTTSVGIKIRRGR